MTHVFKGIRYLLFIVVLGLIVSACAPQTGGQPSAAPTTAAGHGAGHSSTATTNTPFDAMFIDGMIVHHQGAIIMAQQALKEAEHAEIKQLAQNIIRDQQKEMDQMKAWRAQWYPNLAPTQGMGTHMGDMNVSTDTSKPFDQRFITAMISHHQGAIMMAKEAQTKAEHTEIKQLAGEIIKAQEAEIAQMQQWSQAWFK